MTHKLLKEDKYEIYTIWLTNGSMIGATAVLLMISVKNVVNIHVVIRIANGGRNVSFDISCPSHFMEPDFGKDCHRIKILFLSS